MGRRWTSTVRSAARPRWRCRVESRNGAVRQWGSASPASLGRLAAAMKSQWEQYGSASPGKAAMRPACFTFTAIASASFSRPPRRHSIGCEACWLVKPVVRAFIAIDIDAQVREKIARAIDQLKPRVPGVRWGNPANFHLTLKFLGNVANEQIEAIGAALEEHVSPFPRCTINAKGLGVFPDLRRPRIIWVGMAGRELTTLAAEVESVLVPLGFAPEKRNFAPHLTIGRWHQTGRPSKTLGQELAEWTGCEFGATRVDEVILFQSVLKPQGAVYSRLKSVALANQQAQD